MTTKIGEARWAVVEALSACITPINWDIVEFRPGYVSLADGEFDIASHDTICIVTKEPVTTKQRLELIKTGYNALFLNYGKADWVIDVLTQEEFDNSLAERKTSD